MYKIKECFMIPVFSSPNLYSSDPTCLGPTHIWYNVISNHNCLKIKKNKKKEDNQKKTTKIMISGGEKFSQIRI